MMNRLDYLSDEELECLIEDVEQNQMVTAPPDMLEEIFSHVGIKQPITSIREFRRYCFRVCASVAAAVILIFALPVVSDNGEEKMFSKEQYTLKSKYASKEEALSNRSNSAKKLGSANLLDSVIALDIFSRKMEEEK